MIGGPGCIGSAGARSACPDPLALNESAVFRQSRQVAQNLAAELGLGTNVAERVDDRLFYLCHFEGRQAPRNFSMVGRGGPLHSTGLGKALLSDSTPDEVVALVGKTMTGFTPKTLTRSADLLTALDEVRSRGYATEIEGLAFGRACVAAPIRDQTSRVVAAISVSGPLSAIDLDPAPGRARHPGDRARRPDLHRPRLQQRQPVPHLGPQGFLDHPGKSARGGREGFVP